MEINNDPKSNPYHGLDRNIRNHKMSTTKGNNKPGDRLDLSGQKTAKSQSASEIRQDEIARVKANIADGRYQDPQVIGKIIDRIIDQIGF